jgi:hypothetical protein
LFDVWYFVGEYWGYGILSGQEELISSVLIEFSDLDGMSTGDR